MRRLSQTVILIHSSMKPVPSNRFTVKDIALLGMMLAVLEVGKKALEFAPNVEVVTLLFILYARNFGLKALIIAVAFTGLEMFFWGVHTWVIMYLYMWPALILIVYFTRKHGSYVMYIILSAAFGLFFGLFCSIPYLFIGGLQTAFAWWIAGIPYDIIHCVSNAVICAVLFKPLDYVLKKAVKWRNPA